MVQYLDTPAALRGNPIDLDFIEDSSIPMPRVSGTSPLAVIGGKQQSSSQSIRVLDSVEEPSDWAEVSHPAEQCLENLSAVKHKSIQGLKRPLQGDPIHVTPKQSRRNYAMSSPQKNSEIEDREEAFPDHTWDPGKNVDLCNHCQLLDLEPLFVVRKPMKPRRIGFLEDFGCLSCPFCAIIWRSIRIHWKGARPRSERNRRPELFLRKTQWSYKDERSKTPATYRVMVAITQQPPGFKCDTSNKRKDKFVLTELELLSSSTGTQEERHWTKRLIEPQMDPKLLLTWLKLCRSHTACKDHLPDAELFAEGFRLIDVFEDRLVMKTKHCEYVALSYVWGDLVSTGLLANKKNLERLTRHSSLGASTTIDGKRPSLTITDAMKLCRAIGQRYLWVDCLCIVQDDPEEKSRLIHGMNRVYENAAFTIVAASGVNANAGLPGLQHRDVNPYEIPHVIRTSSIGSGTISISLARKSLKEHMENCLWNTRGWTYQEQTLPNRVLYLTPLEAFFECPDSQMREGYAWEYLNHPFVRGGIPRWGQSLAIYRDKHGMVPIPRKGEARSIDDVLPSKSLSHMYPQAVSLYSRRDLTNTDDVLNAFTGIFHRFCESYPSSSEPGISATQGLLSFLLPKALLWFTIKNTGTKPKRRSEILGAEWSSWSWASWVAPIDFVIMENSKVVVKGARKGQRFLMLYNYCLGMKWHLTFKDPTGASRRIQLSINWPQNPAEDIWKDELIPAAMLSMLPLDLEPTPRETLPGTLDFQAPCISIRSLDQIRDNKLPKQELRLVFDGDYVLSCTILYDPDAEESDLEELVVILHDGYFNAICIKTVDGISKRVGVASFIARRTDNSAKALRKLGICWKHVYLR